MKYKRLTERYENGAVQYEDRNGYFHTFYSGNDGDPVHALVWKLAELEDKIEQGTLIELPCKVGDTVYVAYGVSGIDEWEVKEIVIVKNDILFRLTHDGTEDYNAAWLREAGTYLFFTREEAEQHLKELRE